MSSLSVSARREEWSLRKAFTIARGTVTHGEVVVVEVSDGKLSGRGESCPTEHYGESVEGVLSLIEDTAARLEAGEDWCLVHDEVPPGAARNAIDCAIWDLRAKSGAQRVWELIGLAAPRAVCSVLTVSLDEPEIMARDAVAARDHSILKLKLGAPGDGDRVRAVRAAVPEKRLIVDVNEGWTDLDVEENLRIMAECGVEMVEQPLPAGQDACLSTIAHPVPIGADESCHTCADIDHVSRHYDVLNIKLDKTGGLTEALRLTEAGRERGLDVMIGCMLGTSLAMAPAVLVGQFAKYVDLDAPLLIGKDRTPALNYRGEWIEPPASELWG